MSNIEYKPAEKLEVQLSRPDSRLPWGFRLQGGIDFSTPLSIQSVNPNSVSEQCGLKAGDAILAINHRNSDAMAHDDAKEEIQRSGNHITMLIQRGAVKIWKPQVTPLSELRPQELRTITSATGEDVTPVQKTSLAINKPPDAPCTIGSSHNRSAQPFGKPKAAVPNVVHAQYNSPMGLYSANNIADSFAKQTAGIQSQMQNVDLEDTEVGARMTSTFQSLDPSKMHQSPFGTSFSGPQSPGVCVLT
ncbi:PDZ and LIM domain protein 1 [Plakobranchus ocellatus]|uniref:PDZ and LIM domain protein 1 n=1 Tax=Plakobranchus ocellatus TaxID=259542 RepID=A0AAV4D223_9GAST|nr:PDZ and LIM domain protein 1 [Plakobranchus ocellatus]